MAQLTLSFLGPPSVERDGQPLEVDTRKAIALLAYLATAGHTQSRDGLSTLLWPEYDQANARANLRRTLSALKRGLADQWLSVDREHIGLQQGPEIWIDLDQFRRLVAESQTHGHAATEVCSACIEPLSGAAALYRGEFLAGFTLRESAAFDDWQAFQAESLNRDLSAVLDRLTRALSASGAFEPAIGFARRWLALDPLHEPTHRRLMLLFAWAGERAAALRQYRECVRILDEELGVAPLTETTDLAEAIKASREPAPPSESKAPDAGVRSAPSPPPPVESRRSEHVSGESSGVEPFPLVGRAHEWASLVSAYMGARADVCLVAIEGEAGIGKTRLAEEFLAHVRARGGHTIAARCYQDEAQLAYAPIAECLRGALAGENAEVRLSAVPNYALAEAARLVPELASVSGVPIAPPPDGPAAQGRFVDSVAQVLLGLGGADPPGVLLLDDAHLADEGTLELLTYLVRRVHQRPLCVIVTWRSEDVMADHRLRRLVADTRNLASKATSVRLGRLAQADVVELVRAAAAAGHQAPTDSVFKETEGLPFFIVEYLRALAAGDQPGQLMGGVRELLQSRLLGVSQAAMQLLTTAAVIGRSFDFDALRQASGRSDDEAVIALEELLRRGLVREVPGAAESRLIFDFSHVWLRDLVYDETTLSRRRLLHRRVAEALESRRSAAARDPGALAGQIALHYQRAGNDAEAADYFRVAGEHARSLYANAEALSHFRAALALGHAAAASLHEAIGDLLTLAGQYRSALGSYELAAALCSGDQLPRVEHKLGGLYCRSGEWDRAESHFQSAEAELGPVGHDAERARLNADWSLVAQRRGDTPRAVELAMQALQLAEAADDGQALLQAHNVLGILATGQANLEAAQLHLERSLALTEVLDDRAGRIAVLNNLARAYAADGQSERAFKAASAALELCVRQGDRHREAALHNHLADLLHAAGRSEDAMVHLKQAVAIFAEVGSAIDHTQPEIWKLTEW